MQPTTQTAPKPAADQQSRGLAIVGACLLLMGCLIGVNFLPFALLSLIGSQASAYRFTIVMCLGGLMAGPFVVLGGIVMGFGLRRRVGGLRLQPPQVTLNNQNPRVGETVTLHYEQTFNTSTDVRAIRFQLVFREKYMTQSGRSRSFEVRKIVQEYQLPARHFDAGQAFQADQTFQIVGMHSFAGWGNRLDWFIHVQVDMAGWPSFAQDYPLTVPPEMAP